MSASASADYTVIFTVAVDAQGCRWVVDIVRGKGWGFQKQIDLIKEAYAKYQPDVIHAEANQMQRIFTDEIVRETDLPIRKFFTSGVQPKQPWRHGMSSLTMGKHSLDRGVPSLRMQLENKKWRIPRGDARSIEETDVWISEMMSMGWINGKVGSVGDHDDTVMSCWICDAAIRMGGFSFGSGDEAEGQGPGATLGITVPNVADPEIGQYREEIHPNDDVSADLPLGEGAPSALDFVSGGGGGFGSSEW